MPQTARLLLVGHGIAPAEGAGARARRVLEEEGRVVLHAAHERLGSGEVRLVLPGKADDDVGRERDPRHARAKTGDEGFVLGGAVVTLHAGEHPVGARLYRQV